jgi:hypothetical protein
VKLLWYWYWRLFIHSLKQSNPIVGVCETAVGETCGYGQRFITGRAVRIPRQVRLAACGKMEGWAVLNSGCCSAVYERVRFTDLSTRL